MTTPTPRAKTSAPSTAIYARISKDRQESRGVNRQEEECRGLAKRKGWAIAGQPYVDNDISASRYTRKRRPAYRALMEEVREGRISRIVVFKLDRLYRQPKQLEELIDLAEAGKVEIVPVMGGDLDLNSSQGRTMARVAVAMAAGESDNTSERIRSMKLQRRNEGLPNGGPRAFGWKDTLHAHPQESKVLVAAMDAVLAGSSLTDVARRWARAKVSGRSNWTSADVADSIKLPRHAGLLSHHGVVLGPGRWKPIVDRAKWEGVCAIVAGRSNGGGLPRRRSMLTGLVVCGDCGSPMIRSSKGSKRPMVVYRCSAGAGKPGCGRVSIKADLLEPILVEETLRYVDNADLAKIVGKTGRDLSATTKAMAALDRREEQLAKSQGRITRRLFEMTAGSIEAERTELRARLAREAKHSALVAYAGKPGVLRRAWDVLSVDQRRAIIHESLGSVTVLRKGRSGGLFDPNRIVLGSAKPTV